MSSGGYALGIDFGTSSTVAVLRWPDGRVQPLLFDGSPLLPSAVFAPDSETSDQLIVGRDALHRGRFEPAHLEPHPKRRVDERTVLLGNREIAVVDLFAAVLQRVAVEAAKIAPATTALTYPATWAGPRRAVLQEAARRAGLGEPAMIAEPVAAASRYRGNANAIVVYDLGAGTFDASVVVRSASGYEVKTYDGLDDVGGLDLDGALVAWLRNNGYQPPTDPQARRVLWDEVRVAKEMLSTTAAVTLRNNAIGLDTRITREEFEAAVRPLLDRTIHTTVSAMRLAGTPAGAVLRVGGGSRIPLAATLLHRATGIAPQSSEQPELTVAEGALQALPAGVGAERPAPSSVAAVAPPTVRPPVAPQAGIRTRWLVGVVSIILLLLLGAGFGAYKYLDRPDGTPGGAPKKFPGTGASESGDGGLNSDERRLLQSLVGHWTSTSYGDCYIRTDNGVFRMVYPYADGRIHAELEGNRLVGWWTQSGAADRTRAPEGRVEFTISDDGKTLDGRWRYGTDAAWNADWKLSYVDNEIPSDVQALLANPSNFKKGP